MLTIVGLGNPGTQYEKTRHNIGFMVIDELVQKHGFSWKLNKRANALITKEKIDNCDIELIKPQTFMNLSGQSVEYLIKSYTLHPIGHTLIVVHDDIDLEFGTIRVSFDSSSGGHKGIKSIIDHLHSQEFWRIRIGINSGIRNKIDTPEFVLKKFSKEEQKKLLKIIDKSIGLLDSCLSNPPIVQTIHVL